MVMMLENRDEEENLEHREQWCHTATCLLPVGEVKNSKAGRPGCLQEETAFPEKLVRESKCQPLVFSR
uniref:Uncharacterized protein n=1 Tax=Rhizophora mucronata TaxID=61149 RepID=A0A2P2PXW2_RHIMU